MAIEVAARKAFVLDDAIKEQISKVTTLEKAFSFTFLRRLEGMGLKTLPGDSTRIEKHLSKTLKSGKIELPISERRIKALGLPSEEIRTRLEMPIDITGSTQPELRRRQRGQTLAQLRMPG